MIFNRHAKVVMEEGYMRLSVEYTNPKSRSIIFDAIEHIERDMDVHPEVIHRRLKKDSGAFSREVFYFSILIIAIVPCTLSSADSALIAFCISFS